MLMEGEETTVGCVLIHYRPRSSSLIVKFKLIKQGIVCTHSIEEWSWVWQLRSGDLTAQEAKAGGSQIQGLIA